MTSNQTSGFAVDREAATDLEQTPAPALPTPCGTDAPSPASGAGAGPVDHRALVISLYAAGDYVAAANAHALHLYDEWQRHELMFNTARLDKRDSWRTSAVSAQAASYTNWLVAVEKDLRGEVEALVSRWAREAA